MTTVVGIGEFSRLTHLSVKALRHYHDVGVLVPAEVDERTGYRRYALGQLPDAHLVRRLRALDVPLDEVRTVVATADPAERDRVLVAHLDRMERELVRTRDLVASLRDLLASPPRQLAVEVLALADSPALSIADEVAHADIEEWSGATFARLAVALPEVGAVPTGPAGSLFAREFFETGRGRVVAFVPLDDLPAAVTGCTPTTITGGRYAVALHEGPYADLDRTYGDVGGWATEHAAGGAGPIREHYLVGPEATDDPAEYRTQVCWPLRHG